MSKEYSGNRKLLHLIIASIVILTISTGLLSGCSAVKAADNGQSAVKTEDNSIVSSTASATTNNTAMDEFRQLIVLDSTPAVIAAFITDKLTQITQEEASQMVLRFETTQRNYLPGLDNRFTSDSAIQAGLQRVYKTGLSMADVDGIKDEALKELLAETLEGGYKVETAEGMYFPIIDYAFYIKFSPSVPEDIRDYINLMAVESGKVPAKDGALVIGWDEVLDRAFKQEAFIVKYKDSVKAADAGKVLDNYKTFILYGLNNTPLFDYDTKAMNENAKAAYMNTVEKGGSDKLTALLKDYLSVIRNSGYKLTDEVEKFRNNARDTVNLY